MPRRIIVPLDGSSFSEAALPQALGYAGEGGHIDLLTAVEGSAPFAVPEFEVHAQRWAQRYLATVAARIPTDSYCVKTHVVVGTPATELRHFIATTAADFVVMATHGRGPISRAWLGSMADTLVRTAALPVLLVHSKDVTSVESSTDISTFEALDPPKRLLVPLDGSELAEAAIPLATHLATKGSTMTLFRVVQYPYPFVSPYMPDTVSENQNFFKQANTQAREYLTEAAWKIAKEGVIIETRLCVAEHPAQAITDFAKSHKIDLIALATHGYSGVTRLALGSVADKVIRTAEVPVLTLRPKEVAQGDGKRSVAFSTL